MVMQMHCRVNRANYASDSYHSVSGGMLTTIIVESFLIAPANKKS